MAGNTREGFQVEFECGHTMVYDRHSQHGVPEIGQRGRCHQCDSQPEPNAGIDRTVTGLRRCWIETITNVRFDEPKNAWWREFDNALHHALAQGRGPLAAEEYAADAAETKHRGGRDL